jgi:hypothetical protein
VCTELASYQLTAPGATFVNDVVVTRDAAYFTDSLNQVLYVVRLGRGGRLPEAAEVLPLAAPPSPTATGCSAAAAPSTWCATG